MSLCPQIDVFPLTPFIEYCCKIVVNTNTNILRCLLSIAIRFKYTLKVSLLSMENIEYLHLIEYQLVSIFLSVSRKRTRIDPQCVQQFFHGTISRIFRQSFSISFRDTLYVQQETLTNTIGRSRTKAKEQMLRYSNIT